MSRRERPSSSLVVGGPRPSAPRRRGPPTANAAIDRLECCNSCGLDERQCRGRLLSITARRWTTTRALRRCSTTGSSAICWTSGACCARTSCWCKTPQQGPRWRPLRRARRASSPAGPTRSSGSPAHQDRRQRQVELASWKPSRVVLALWDFVAASRRPMLATARLLEHIRRQVYPKVMPPGEEDL